MSDLTWHNDTRKLGELVPWPRNPRKIGTSEAERLKQSLEQFNQPQVIAIGPNNEIYDGHQRLKAWGEKWGPDLEVAVRASSRPLTEQERKQLTVLLHRGTMGEWDFEALKTWDAGELLEWGFDEGELVAEGFEFEEEEPPADPGAQVDRAAELQEKWQVQRGQVWEVLSKTVAGRCHRVMCGDCTDRAVVEQVVNGEKAAFGFADPPYNAGVDEWDKDFEWQHDHLLSYAHVVAVTPGIVSIQEFLQKTKMPYVWSIGAWVTNGRARSAIGFGNWIYAAVFATESVYRQAQDFFVIDLIPGQANEHRGQKPLSYMEQLVELFTKRDDDVVEYFDGSGTTIVACERLGRRCRAVEIEPKFVAVTLERLAGMGLEPRLTTEN